VVWVKSIPIVVGRVLLGLVFFGFGLNGLLHILPLPRAQGVAAVFIRGLIASRYFFPLLFITYVFTGAALLIGRFVPLALSVLAPIIVNIAVMHFFVPSSGAEICLATLVTGLEIYLAWSYRVAFQPLLSARYDFSSAERQTCRRTH
jgi:putative oxidoreductase